MCNINHPKFPCKICAKNVQDKDKAVQCDLCELWIHMKCNNLYLDYRYLQNCNKSWYCIKCCSTIFPFNFLSSSKNFLACCTTTDSNITQLKDLESDHDSSLLLKPSANLGLLVNQFNNATPENGNDPEKITSSKYYDIDEMHNIEIPHKNKPLSLFHINAQVLLVKILMIFNISWTALIAFWHNSSEWNNHKKRISIKKSDPQ